MVTTDSHVHIESKLLLEPVMRALDARGLLAQTLALVPDGDPGGRGDPASRLLHAAEQLTGNPSIGIELAHATTILASSPLVYFMMSAPTLGAALQGMMHYARVPLHRAPPASLLVEKDVTTLRCGSVDGGRPYTTYIAALLVRLCRYIVDDPRFTPVEARFTFSAPSKLDAWRDVFGERLRFDEPQNALVFSREQLARPSAHAAPALHTLHEEVMREALRRETEESILRQTHDVVDDCLSSGRPTRARIARALGVSARVLQRRLHDRGTTLDRLVHEAREQRALELLREPSVSVDDVASAAGYHSLSSFYRAFQSWTGMTPAAYRAAHTTTVAAPPSSTSRGHRRTARLGRMITNDPARDAK